MNPVLRCFFHDEGNLSPLAIFCQVVTSIRTCTMAGTEYERLVMLNSLVLLR